MEDIIDDGRFAVTARRTRRSAGIASGYHIQGGSSIHAYGTGMLSPVFCLLHIADCAAKLQGYVPVYKSPECIGPHCFWILSL